MRMSVLWIKYDKVMNNFVERQVIWMHMMDPLTFRVLGIRAAFKWEEKEEISFHKSHSEITANYRFISQNWHSQSGKLCQVLIINKC